MPARAYFKVNIVNQVPLTFYIEIFYGNIVHADSSSVAGINIFLNKPENRGWEIHELNQNAMIKISFTERKLVLCCTIGIKLNLQMLGTEDKLLIGIKSISAKQGDN